MIAAGANDPPNVGDERAPADLADDPALAFQLGQHPADLSTGTAQGLGDGAFGRQPAVAFTGRTHHVVLDGGPERDALWAALLFCKSNFSFSRERIS